MRTLSILEMDAVSGGEKTRLQNLGQCVAETVMAGAAGVALGMPLAPVTGGLSMKIGAAAGMIGTVIGADSCIAALT